MINKTNDKSFNFFSENFYIHGAFDSTISTEVIPQFVKEIEAKKKLKDPVIKFYINSDGGYTRYVQDLLGLFEIAKDNGIIIETYVLSYAYSCGSLLACAGSPGHRYISEFAEHLCHLGSTGTGTIINDTEADRMIGRVKRHFDWVRRMYKKYAKIKNLNKVIHDDCYFIEGQDIIDNGLADKFIV